MEATKSLRLQYVRIFCISRRRQLRDEPRVPRTRLRSARSPDDGRWRMEELVGTNIVGTQWLGCAGASGWERYERGIRAIGAKRRIMYHGHCHQKAEVGIRATVVLLRRIPGVEVVEIDAGCCGMAGSFGFEEEHYEISMDVARDRFLPALQAEPRQQLLQRTERKGELATRQVPFRLRSHMGEYDSQIVEP